MQFGFALAKGRAKRNDTLAGWNPTKERAVLKFVVFRLRQCPIYIVAQNVLSGHSIVILTSTYSEPFIDLLDWVSVKP